MPSKEDYLDNLLKDMDGIGETVSENSDVVSDNERKDDILDEDIMNILNSVEDKEVNDVEDKDDVTESESIGVDDTKSMSEEEIEKLLSAESENTEEADSAQEETSEDLMNLLKQTDDNNDLQEIHDLLQKSDNNEAVDNDIVALLQDTPDEETDLMEQIVGEPEKNTESGVDERTKKKEERKRLREEKKAEKLALKEAKKAAKLEAKKAKEEGGRQDAESEEAEASELSFDAEGLGTADLEPANTVSEEDLADIEELLNMAGSVMEPPVEFAAGTAKKPAALGGNNAKGKDTQENNAQSNGVDSLVENVTAEKKPRKKLFNRILDFLTEEDEEEEQKDNEDIKLSEENKNIIEDLDKDKKKKKKGKKDKKTKKGEQKNGKENIAESENAEENADEGNSKKPKKEKKAKKEKLPKEVRIEEDNQKDGKLSVKKILPVALACVSFGIVIVLVASLAGDYSAKKAGREAYYDGDYQTCFQNFYGKELNESEQVMYSKSESILRIRLWIREYEMLAEEGAEAEALDSLIQSVGDYPVLYEYAVQWNAGGEVSESYATILSILSEKYNLTEAQAQEIAAMERDVDYSQVVYAIIDGKASDFLNKPVAEEPEKLQDVLPEEEEIENTSFVDNGDN